MNHIPKSMDFVDMIWVLIAILCLLWLAAVIVKFTVGGLIHILLVVAVIVGLMRLLRGRRA